MKNALHTKWIVNIYLKFKKKQIKNNIEPPPHKKTFGGENVLEKTWSFFSTYKFWNKREFLSEFQFTKK